MYPTPTEVTVNHGPMRLAARDYGGDGTAVLLLHGLGGSVDVWDRFAPPLTAHHRVIAFDLRGHGRSGDGDWDWSEVLDDVAAVITHFGIAEPTLIGQSLGGVVAGMWGRDRSAAAVVSLDGHRSAATDEAHYAGMEPNRLREDLRQLNAMFEQQSQAMAAPLPVEHLAMLPPRTLTEVDGETYLRPTRRLAEQVRYDKTFLDAVPVFAEVKCPVLMVAATTDPPGMPPQFAPLMDAYRQGLRRDLESVTSRNERIRIEWWPGSHVMLDESAEELRDLLSNFISRVTG